MKNIINASFFDKIQSYQYRQSQLKKVSYKLIRVEQDLTDIKTVELIKLLQNLDNYLFEDNYIIYNRFLTTLEVQKEIKEIKEGIEYDIYRLKKWCKSSTEWENQIKSYLLRHNIQIKSINS